MWRDNFNLRDVLRAAVINVGEEQQDQVVNDQSPYNARRAPGENQRQSAEREKNEEAASENHMTNSHRDYRETEEDEEKGRRGDKAIR